MSDVFTLRVKERLAEYDEVILDKIHKYKKVGLFAGMGIGKTEFFKKALREYAKRNNLVLIMVNPSVGQIEQMGEAQEIETTIYEGKSYYGEKVVVSTPESLYKVMGDILEKQQKFILVFDEAHEKVTGINFRRKFGVVDKYEAYAEKVIYMTATPEPLFNENFDCIIDIDTISKQKVACRVLNVDKTNVALLINRAEASIMNGENVVICHDNKLENKKIYEALVNKFGADYLMALEDNEPKQLEIGEEYEPKTIKANSFDVVSSQDRSGQAYKSIMTGEWPKGLKALITTSFIKAGININNPNNTRMILTVNERNFLLSDKIQQMGRLRNREGIVSIDIICPKIETPKQYTKFLPLEQVNENITDISKYVYETQIENALSVPSRTSLDVACATYDLESDSYMIDNNILRNRVYSEYCRQLLVFPHRLKIDLERQKAITLDVSISDINSIENEALNEELKLAKADSKKAYVNALEQMKQLTSEEQELIIQVEYDNIQALADESLIPIAKAYRLQMPEADRKRIKEVKDNLTDGNRVAAHLKVLLEDKKDIQRELDQAEVRKINNQYKMVIDSTTDIEKLKRLYKKRGKLNYKVFFIRQYLQDLEKKQGRLSNKRLNELAQTMIDNEIYKGKKINLEKARAMLHQDLNLIFELRADGNGYNFISSVKK